MFNERPAAIRRRLRLRTGSHKKRGPLDAGLSQTSRSIVLVMVTMMMTAVRTAGRANVGRTQLDIDDAGNSGEAGLALQAERLQRERIGRTADEEVRADADADSRVGANATVVTGESARAHAIGRSMHGPGKAGLLGHAEVETEAVDAGDVRLDRATVIAAEDALELGRRTNDETDVLTALAFENADLHALLRIGGCK